LEPKNESGLPILPNLSSSSAFHSRLSIFYAPLAGRYGCKVWSFDSKLAPSQQSIQLFCFYPWKMLIPTGAVWCRSCKEGEFGWLITSSTAKKKHPNKMDFSFVPKEEKNKTKFFIIQKRRKRNPLSKERTWR
jgi:hypothetical protein